MFNIWISRDQKLTVTSGMSDPRYGKLIEMNLPHIRQKSANVHFTNENFAQESLDRRPFENLKSFVTL